MSSGDQIIGEAAPRERNAVPKQPRVILTESTDNC